MTHSTHDLEILASYASDYQPDGSAAAALLATCGECRLVFDEQVRMRSVLSQAGPAKLSEAEQARLLPLVLSSLPKPSGTSPVSMERKPASKHVSPIWGRVLAAAAALAVVVGVGAIVPNRANQSATTMAAADAGAPEFATGDQRAAAATTAAAGTLYELTASDDLDELKAEAEALGEESAPAYGGTANLDAQCSTETEDLTIRATGESTYQGRPVILLLAESDGELGPRAFYADDCTEIPLP